MQLYIFIYNKKIFELIIAKDMERIQDIFIVQPIFLIYQRLR